MNSAKFSGLSVVIPAFNAESSIGRAIDSAWAAKADVVIVVDDGSTDGTGRVAKQHGAVVLAQKNAGAARARKAGVAAVSSEFTILLDADDALIEGGVQRSLLLLRSHERVGIAGGATIGRRADESRLSLAVPRRTVSVRTLIRDGYSPCPPVSLVWRSSILKVAANGPMPAVWARYADDYELLIRGAALSEVRFHSEPAGLYELSGGKSMVVPVRSLEISEEIRAHYGRLFGIRVHRRSDRKIRARAVLRARMGKARTPWNSRVWEAVHAAWLDPVLVGRLAFSKAMSCARPRATD
ncbi:glycosyltransferase family A protein [Rhodococcus ruber]|uniref:glycosyltransferase family A protein n=1 Tax=Rhodococcus ruber TaxID=1830 RepID=UPI003D814F90